MEAARPAPRALLAVLLACALPSAAGGFTAGNVVVLRVGDGSVANAPAGSNNSVPCSLVEYAVSGWGVALTLVPTGVTVPLPSTPATASSYMLTQLGDGADFGGRAFTAGNNGGNAVGGVRPLGGVLTNSADGQFVVLAGYSMAAGMVVGPAQWYAPSVPSVNVSRVVGVVDGLGNVNVNAALVAAAFGAIVVRSAFLYSSGATTGVLAVGGWANGATPGGIGGLYYMGTTNATGASLAPSFQVVATQNAATATNIEYMTGVSYDPASGKVFLSRGASSTSAGLYFASALPPYSSQPAFTALLDGAVLAAATLFDVRATIFTNSYSKLWVLDSATGLSLFTGCTSVPSCANAVIMYTTMVPGAVGTTASFSSAGIPLYEGTNNLLGMVLVAVGNVNVLAVTTPYGIYLWPLSNTGPFSSTTGTCCSTTTSGACCWLNGNNPVAPPANAEFRGIAMAPAVPVSRRRQRGAPRARATLSGPSPHSSSARSSQSSDSSPSTPPTSACWPAAPLTATRGVGRHRQVPVGGEAPSPMCSTRRATPPLRQRSRPTAQRMLMDTTARARRTAAAPRASPIMRPSAVRAALRGP